MFVDAYSSVSGLPMREHHEEELSGSCKELCHMCGKEDVVCEAGRAISKKSDSTQKL